MNKIFIILGVLICVMIGVVLKSNSDQKAREEALAQQTQQHNQKMAQIEAENQARLAQEIRGKAQKEQARIESNRQANLESEKQKQNIKQIDQQEVNQGEATQQARSIEEKARRNLFDPEAAKFRNIKGNCGEINAKNKMGGYTGYRRFIYDPKFDTVSIEDENDGLYNPKMMDILWGQKCPN